MDSKLLSILSLNARGLREKKKRENCFYWIKENKLDIIFLQETYWTPDLLTSVEKEWGGRVLLSTGTNHSKGTAILFRNRLDVEIKNTHQSADGRIVLANIKTNDKELTIVNIYAPNDPKDRKTFFQKIKKWLDNHAINKDEIIIGGDFNFTENNMLDRKDKFSSTADSSASAYNSLIQRHSLCDIWRDMHPNKKQFTYKEISRLDKFLISEQCSNYTLNSYILNPGIKSDHKGVKIILNINNNMRGPGVWKLNTNILNDSIYKEKIKILIQGVKEKYNFLSKQMLWEICKIKIREYTIGYCTKKQKTKKSIIKQIENEIEQKEEELVASNYDHKILQEKNSKVDKLHTLVEEQKVGAQIRSRAKWIEEGEKCTKYFFNLEKQHCSNNTIKQLKRENGTYTTSDREILEEQHKYYKNLYDSENISEESMNSHLKNIKMLNTLSEQEAKLLEGTIKEDECKNAIDSMKLNKSPGSDGIPVEFYKIFWEDIKTLLIESINSAYQTGEMTITQRKGILKLLYKKNEKTSLSNWRPISLLNTDYKILAHVLAQRLKKVIHKVIHTDQVGYIKGRNINTNIRLIQDVIDYFEDGKEEGAIIFLDFQKAFDTVNHEFLHKVLSKFNFGASFKKWINIIYKNAQSCVSNNGWISQPFNINRGIRQGCPLSALLFLLVVEILAVQVRTEQNDGLKINVRGEDKFINITQLADDTTLFVKDKEAIIKNLKLIEDFGEVSGLKLNKEKTEGLWIGVGENRQDMFAGINWKKNCIKALGVYFGYNKKEVELLNWKTKVENVKSCLKCWNSRDLSLQGRVLVIKTIALPKVIYLSSSIHTPDWVVNELNKEFFSFLWRYKRDKIARKVVLNEIENGGLNMIDFKNLNISMKAMWAYKLHTNNEETWTILPKKYFESCGIEKILCMNFENEKHSPIKLPSFYAEVLKSWHLCGGGKKAPQNAYDIRKEIIWGNKYIQSKGKTLYFKNWTQCGINFVDDILNANGKFKTGEEIFHKLNIRINWLSEYQTILKSIPKLWKEKLQTGDMNTKVKKDLVPFLNINKTITYDLPKKARGYYNILIKGSRKRSFNENYWSNLFPDRPTWTNIYLNKIKNQKVKKLADFHFKLLHRVLPCQENLHHWKISDSNKCRFGCPSTENYHHLFITCPQANNVITHTEKTLKGIGFNVKITYKTLIIGHKLAYNAYKPLNLLISHIFYAIFKYWVKNDKTINIKCWTICELKKWDVIYKRSQERLDIIEKFIEKW